MTDTIEALITEIADRVLDSVESRLRDVTVSRSTSRSDLDPLSLYKAGEAAEILGLDRATMYDIPEAELPRCHIGPARGATRWMGADLLAYARGLDPIDYEEVLEDLRDELRRPHSREDAPEEGKTRVL